MNVIFDISGKETPVSMYFFENDNSKVTIWKEKKKIWLFTKFAADHHELSFVCQVAYATWQTDYSRGRSSVPSKMLLMNWLFKKWIR